LKEKVNDKRSPTYEVPEGNVCPRKKGVSITIFGEKRAGISGARA